MSCELDPIPTHLVIDCISVLLTPIDSSIVFYKRAVSIMPQDSLCYTLTQETWPGPEHFQEL